MDLTTTLSECAGNGDTLVIQMPDDRLLTVRSLDPTDDQDDDLINQLIDHNPAFRAMLERANQGKAVPFEFDADLA
jgi:hypothetical protein